MASIKTKITVGLFVIVGLVFAVIVIIWIGMSHYFEEGKLYVAYFDESVQGLDRDSPVKYRGVPVGRVNSIDVAPDSILIEVVMKIESGLELEKDMENLVAQLKSVGITGIMFVGLDRKRGQEPEVSPEISFTPRHPVIATQPSDIKKYMEGLEDVLTQLGSMDVQGISTRVKTILDNLNQTVEDAQIKNISVDIRSSLSRLEEIIVPQKWNNIIDTINRAGNSINTFTSDASKTVLQINHTVARLDTIVADNEKGIYGTIENLQKTTRHTDAIMENSADLIKDTSDRLSTLLHHLIVTEQNLEAASDNLNQFIERVADQPSQLVFGEPPPAKPVQTSEIP